MKKIDAVLEDMFSDPPPPAAKPDYVPNRTRIRPDDPLYDEDHPDYEASAYERHQPALSDFGQRLCKIGQRAICDGRVHRVRHYNDQTGVWYWRVSSFCPIRAAQMQRLTPLSDNPWGI